MTFNREVKIKIVHGHPRDFWHNWLRPVYYTKVFCNIFCNIFEILFSKKLQYTNSSRQINSRIGIESSTPAALIYSMKFSLDLRINSPLRVWGFMTVVTLMAVGISLAATSISLTIVGITNTSMAYIIATAVPALTVPPIAYLIAHYAYRLYLAHQTLFYLAHTDELTGLANRRHFFAQGQDRLARALVTGESIGLMVLDADNFKQINDSAGHAAGDKALFFLAQTLKAYVEPNDLVARIGGDEFAIMRSAATTTEMTLLATHISRQLAQAVFFYNDRPFSLSVSIGIADTQQTTSFEQLLRASDLALYQKKLDSDAHLHQADLRKRPITEIHSVQTGDLLHYQD